MAKKYWWFGYSSFPVWVWKIWLSTRVYTFWWRVRIFPIRLEQEYKWNHEDEF